MERTFTEALFAVLKSTTGIEPDELKVSETTTTTNDKSGGYELQPTELDDPTVQLLELNVFERKLGIYNNTSKDTDWSDEIEEILVKYRENLRLRNPKKWTRESISRRFRTLRLTDMNIKSLDRATKGFKRLRSLSISRNSVSALKNLPKSLKVLYAFRNNMSKVENTTETEDQPDLIGLGLGFNRFRDVASIVNAFPSIRVLDIGYNELCSLEDLIEELKKLKYLEQLTLIGNPCTMLPTYRERVVTSLPSLRVLDGESTSSISSSSSSEEKSKSDCSFTLKIDFISRESAEADEPSCFELECSFSGQTWTSEVFRLLNKNKRDNILNVNFQMKPSIKLRDSLGREGVLVILRSVSGVTPTDELEEAKEDVSVEEKNSSSKKKKNNEKKSPRTSSRRSTTSSKNEKESSKEEETKEEKTSSSVEPVVVSRNVLGATTIDTASVLKSSERQASSLASTISTSIGLGEFRFTLSMCMF